MKRLCFVMLMSCILFFAIQSAWGENNHVEFTLKGFEIAMGTNADDEIRVGARFMGNIFSVAGNEVGFFSTVLDFSGYDDIEVCEGTNDIISLRMTIFFTSGDYVGRVMVLKMVDTSPENVFWYLDTSENCGIGGMGCNCPPVLNLEACDIDGDQTALIAWVGSDFLLEEGINLRPTWGSSFIFLRNVDSASLSGYLCHHYPFIPRVSGKIRFELR